MAATHAKSTESPAAEEAVQPIHPTSAQKVHASKKILGLIGIFDAVVAYGLARLFPADLAATTVRALLVGALEEKASAATTGSAQSTAVARRNADVKKAKRLLRRVTNLVDSAYPNGNPARADFFTPAGVHPTVSTKLEAMANGLSTHGLPLAPPDITVAKLVATAHAVAHDTAARTSAGVAMETAVGARHVTQLQLEQVRRRIVQALRGYFGEDSKELEKFGLKPIVRKGPTRRRKATEEEKAARRAEREKAAAAREQALAQKKADRAKKLAQKADQKASDAEKAVESANGPTSVTTGGTANSAMAQPNA